MWDDAGEERKIVTVLFADLVGSTELSGRLDPEVLRAVMVRYFKLLAARIERHGGTVEKFIGDAVMAVFGVPVTHEDDVRRALAAATGMLEDLRELNVEVDARHQIRLQVRIGVNTGEVIATRDAGPRQTLVSGETVNLAARLEQHAGAGEILIGADTHATAGATALTGEARSLLVKGKARPIDAYPLLGLLPDDPAAIRRFDLSFVGRARELAALDRAAEWAATARASNLVVVYGDPGVGKTRLLTEWLARMPPGPTTAMTRCRAHPEEGSLQPLLDIAAQLASDSAPAADALGPLHAQLDAASRGDLRPPDLYACLADFITAQAGLRLVVLVIDDVQWASTLLLETVDRLCEDLGGQPLLCVCAARTDFADSGPRLGPSLLNYASLHLGPLPDDEAALFAEALPEVTAHSAETVRHLVELAEGNPLYLEQLAAACRDGYEVRQIPPTVRALIAARLDVLPASERRALELAAVIGREFAVADLAALHAANGWDVTGLDVALRVLTRRRLLVEHRTTGPSSCRFASTLIRDVTYKSMTKTRRAALHEQVAATAEPVPGSTEPQPRGDVPADGKAPGNGQARAGCHLEMAYRCRRELGEAEEALAPLRRRALAHLVAAGSAALHGVDLPWALDLLSRAADLALPGDPAGAAALELYGEVLHATGARDRALTTLTSALARAQAHGQRGVAAHARLVIAHLDPAAGPVADIAREAADTFAAEGDDLGLARTRVRIGMALQAQGRYERALGELDAALTHSVLAGTDIERANALGAIGQSLWLGPEPAPQAVARCRALLGEYGDGRRAVQATLGFALTMLLEIAGSEADAADQLAVTCRVMTELRYGESPVFCPLLEGLVAMSAGETGQAIAVLRRAHDAAVTLASGSLVSRTARELARALLTAGHAGEAAAALAAVTTADGMTERADLAGLRAWRAGMEKDAPGARAWADEAVAVARRTDSPLALATACHDQARALLELGFDARPAARLPQPPRGGQGRADQVPRPVCPAAKASMSPASVAALLTDLAPCPTWPSDRSRTGWSEAVACCSAAHIL